uniref:Uncharacterized protein n=1 Tax=Avena sativa TaxID=4498 RepID=A0ACD5Z5N2_AVESA
MVTPECSLSHVLAMAALILLSTSLSLSSSSTTSNNETTMDREALLCLKSHLSDPRGGLATWSNNASLDFCRWHGVSCSKQQTQRRVVVVALDLEGEGLAGQLPPCVSNLTSLARIHLANNRLTGGVPRELGLLAGLSYLNLSNNALGGKIPANLSSCSGLEVLALGSNSIEGEIPPHLCASLPSLRTLSLGNNSLSGAAPASIFSNPSIEEIDLSMNQLSGPIPGFPTNSSPSLQLIDLTLNSFTGEIPSSIGNLTSLTALKLSGNQLQGTIPSTLVRASGMEFLDLTYNNFSGIVPIFVYNFTLLQYLGLGNNAFGGRLPSDMGKSLPNLRILAMSVNHLEGPIPQSLGNASKLEGVYLASNNFSGLIPSFGSLKKLDTLMMFSNSLAAGDWAFLYSLTNCKRLARVSLSENNLRGELPISVANLSKSLEVLDLGSNRISGTIPDEIDNLLNLTMLYLDGNLLTGKIPSTLGHLSNLGSLVLSRNQFYGEIPSSLGNLGRLNILQLQENDLTGTIPADLSRCTSLAALNLSCNSLHGSVPTKLFSGLNQLNVYLDLSYNQLTSSLPFQIGGLVNLISLNISHNKFTDQIPSTLGSCLLLQSVHMEGNQLEGSIPQSLMNLKGVMELDFSQNNLSGEIPHFFGDFTTLQYLNLSFNNLNGPIPMAGVFSEASKVFVQGNPRLCTDVPMPQQPLCSASEDKRRHPLLKPLVVAGVALVVVLLVVFMIIVILRKRRKITRPLNNPANELTVLSYGDLRKATNGFSFSNLIGSGQFGEVYKAVLHAEADPVAVKVFKLNEYGAFDSFISECEALRYIRHRNLVKVITVCSTYDPVGNEFKALVLEFMANGTLESRLHNNFHHYSDLTLAARICIAVDIASALDYLHNHCVQPLVHCDLKPSNILFDENNNAHVCDFGLARFLHGCYSCTRHNMPASFVGPRGSAGYIAPEYAMGSKISTDGDIYSFGIIILEMLTRKRPTDVLFKDGLTLHKYVEESYPHYIEVVDPDLLAQFESEQPRHASKIQEKPAIAQVQSCIVKLLKIGLICSSDSPRDRPKAHDVYNNLIAVMEEELNS